MDCLEITLKLFQTIAVCSGVIIAFCGLQTWRRQLEGTTKYELSKNILRNAYMFQREVDFFRSRFFTDPKEYEEMSEQEQFNLSLELWEKRRERLYKHIIELDILGIESKVIFKEDKIGSLISKISQSYSDLRDNLDMYLERINPKNEYDYKSDPENRKIKIELRKNLYGASKNDPITENISATIVEMKKHLEGHL